MVDMQRIINLLSEAGISGAKMSKELGFSNAVYSQWMHSQQRPSLEKIERIADYFNVSVDYLLGRTPIKEINLPQDTQQDDQQTHAAKPLKVGPPKLEE